MNIVLHVCCGVCAAGVVERLTGEGYRVSGFFYNPNIHPLAEYARRLEAAHKVAEEFDFHLEVPPYSPEEWFAIAESLKDEPEGGRRCEVCFRLRLERTYLYMKECGGDVFTTTLSVSSLKPADVINRIGREVGGERYLARDFKKREGFRRSIEIAKKLALYRQDYCGCVYSIRRTQSDSNVIPSV